MLPCIILPADGVEDESIVQALSSVTVSNKFQGDARCSAGMNVLHYVAVQPQLLLRPSQNLALKLIDLLLKTGPDVNGKVSPTLEISTQVVPTDATSSPS
jgi:hypothetical protein